MYVIVHYSKWVKHMRIFSVSLVYSVTYLNLCYVLWILLLLKIMQHISLDFIRVHTYMRSCPYLFWVVYFFYNCNQCNQCKQTKNNYKSLFISLIKQPLPISFKLGLHDIHRTDKWSVQHWKINIISYWHIKKIEPITLTNKAKLLLLT